MMLITIGLTAIAVWRSNERRYRREMDALRFRADVNLSRIYTQAR